MSDRVTKVFWYADLENLRVIESTGLSTQTPDVWWFAELGYSLTIEIHVFNSPIKAEKALRIAATGALRNHFLRIQKIVDFLTSETGDPLPYQQHEEKHKQNPDKEFHPIG